MATVPRTQGRTLPCLICGAAIRIVSNPHTGGHTTYHGEDVLIRYSYDAPLPTSGEAAQELAAFLLNDLIRQIGAFHGVELGSVLLDWPPHFGQA